MIAYLIAFVIGTWFGVFIMSLCAIASDSDKKRGEK